jgi:hypothetical protein
MTRISWKAASIIAIGLLLAGGGAALFLGWFVTDDCAEAMRRSAGLSPDQYRALAQRCAAEEQKYDLLNKLGLLLIPVVILLWWLPRSHRRAGSH